MDSAKELEILAVTGVPRRLIKAILRIGKKILDSGGEIRKKEILLPSRSGDLYNSLKYLIKEGIVVQNNEEKTIRVTNLEKLNHLIAELEDLI